jgi:hypothetical protein
MSRLPIKQHPWAEQARLAFCARERMNMNPRKIPHILKKKPKQVLKKVPRRHVDYPSLTYWWNEDVDVRCPRCQKHGVVTKQSFTCLHCGKQEKIEPSPACKVDEICSHCQRHFRIEITDPVQQRLKTLHVQCPHCHVPQNSQVKIYSDGVYRVDYDKTPGERLRKGKELTFGLTFYYQTTLHGKVLWALNRAHLLCLIDYLEADLREHRGFDGMGMMRRTFAKVPGIFKVARHRKTLVKRLKNLLNPL